VGIASAVSAVILPPRVHLAKKAGFLEPGLFHSLSRCIKDGTQLNANREIPEELVAIRERAEASLALNNYLQHVLSNKPKGVSRRAMFAMAAFDLAIEHHRSMALLIESGGYGTAYALLRPLIEAEIAGRWLSTAISDAQADELARTNICPKPEQMLKAIEKSIPPEKRIRTLLDGEGRILHDFTHSGIEQWTRRLREGSVQANYSCQEIDGVLTIADMFVMLSALGIGYGCGMATFVEETIQALELMRRRVEDSKDIVFPKKCKPT